jgi:hypothetical protein
LTQPFRDQHEIRKLEKQAYRTPDFIRDHFEKNETATAAEIARTSANRPEDDQSGESVANSGSRRW